MSSRDALHRLRRAPAAAMLAAFLMGFLPGHAHGGSLVADHQAQVAADGELSALGHNQQAHDHGESRGAEDPVDHGADHSLDDRADHSLDHGADHDAPHGHDTCPGCHCPTGATSCGAVAPAPSPTAGPAAIPFGNFTAAPDLALPRAAGGSLFRPPRD